MRASKCLRIVLCAGVTCSAMLAASPALAAFHLWQVKEVFSNSDGSVQFIEMFDSFGGANVTSAGRGGKDEDFLEHR